MIQQKIFAGDKMRWRMLAYLSIALIFSLSTWFSATAVIPQLINLPYLQELLSWRWAFAILAFGPMIGILAMLRLKSLPEAGKIGGGKG